MINLLQHFYTLFLLDLHHVDAIKCSEMRLVLLWFREEIITGFIKEDIPISLLFICQV